MISFKNILLSVVAIPLLVIGQLSIAQYSGDSRFFINVRELLVSSNSSSTNLPLIIQSTFIEPKKEILTSSISRQLKNEINELISSQESNRYLILLQEYKDYEKVSQRVESIAKKFLGVKYVWGANGPNKFDCSGFTQKIYKTAGIQLPRNSRAQAKVGKYIKYEELKKGDMVFFDTNRKQTVRVNHVGIYLENGTFIHASSGNKKVVITNFKEKQFYKNRFLWGRRIIKERHFKMLSSREDSYSTLRKI